MAPACVYCGRGFHRECRKCRKGNCHSQTEEPTNVEDNYDEVSSSSSSAPKKKRKSEDNLLDPKSTGRKRAAKLYPLDSNASCEWRGLRDCGGGRRPVIGCLDGTQKHRHHGPVKDPRRNVEGNVHRICTSCHVHWHELNDLIYNEADYRLLPHQPVPATELEIIQNALDWTTGKMGERYELASTQNHSKYQARVLSDESSDEE